MLLQLCKNLSQIQEYKKQDFVPNTTKSFQEYKDIHVVSALQEYNTNLSQIQPKDLQ